MLLGPPFDRLRTGFLGRRDGVGGEWWVAGGGRGARLVWGWWVGPGSGMRDAGSDGNAINSISACFAGHAGKAGRDRGGSDVRLERVGREPSAAVETLQCEGWCFGGDGHPVVEGVWVRS